MNAVESGAERPSLLRARRVIRGLYAITPDWDDTARLVAAVGETLSAGTRLLQYRNKAASLGKKREQLGELIPLCRGYGCTLVVNDDWRLALELGVDAVHVGSDDGDVETVRREIGPEVILGVSCYADLERARHLAPMADYLAFGSVFPSRTKPEAVSAALAVFAPAKLLDRPMGGSGGSDAANARRGVEAGADAVAVISAVFGEEAVGKTTSGLVTAVSSLSSSY